MSQWTDRVSQHSIFTEFTALGSIIDRLVLRWGIDATTIASIERVRSVLTYAGKRIAAADPDLVDPRVLTSVANALAAARTSLEAYSTDSNAAHLDAANAQADDALSALGSIPSVQAPDDLTWVQESTGAYRSTIEKHLNETLSKHGEVLASVQKSQAAVDELTAQTVAAKEKLTATQSEQGTQFSAAQDLRATEFATAQADRQSQHAEALSAMQTSFTNAQNERQEKAVALAGENQAKFAADQESRVKAFTTSQEDRLAGYAASKTEYSNTIGEYTKELTRLKEAATKAAEEALQGLRTTYEASGRQILDQMEARKLEVEKLVGVIGNLGVTSGYQISANRAQSAAYLWQFLTVAALSGLIYVAYVIAFAPPSAESLFFQGLATRVFLSVTVGIFAAYAARQASLNLDIERKHRKLALELEALGPFIAPLPEEMQNKFRAELGDRSFGIPDGEAPSNSREPVTATDLLPLLKDLINRVK